MIYNLPDTPGPEVPLSMWASAPYLIVVPWAHLSPSQSISIGYAVLGGFTIVTDRSTDHATPSVAIGRIY